MKKLFVFVLTATLVFSAFSYAKAGPSVDQQYTGGGASVSIDASLGRFAQTFKPTYSKLDKVEIELTNVVGSHTISVSIRHRTNLIWDAGNVTTVSNQVITNGWNTFDFEDITVGLTDADTYGIWINCPDNGPQWKWTNGPSTYSRGFAIWQSNDQMDQDYNFKTWGYEPTEIVAENTQATDEQNTAATTTVGSTETLGATSTSIVKPTTLTADYSDTDRGVKLAWKASSTADIDGYKVFRYEGDIKTPVKIASTTKDKLEYLDTNVVAGKTYSYQVRAYKTDTQSVSSNIASATVPADAAPAKPVNFKVVDKTFSSLEVMWRKSTDPNISGYTLNLYRGGDKIRTAEIPTTVRDYSFLNLDAGTLYKIELIAKSSNGLTSTPAVAVGFTQLPEALERFMDTTRTIAGLAVLILLLILAINTSKHYKQKR